MTHLATYSLGAGIAFWLCGDNLNAALCFAGAITWALAYLARAAAVQS